MVGSRVDRTKLDRLTSDGRKRRAYLVSMTTDIAPGTCAPATCDILIIEDDPTQAEELRDFLQRGGYRVHTMLGGSEALHHLDTCQPRMAVIDYNLPDLDGMTVAERVRRLSPDTALLLMSGRIDGVPSAVLEEAGVLGFLNKPIALDRLRKLVRKALPAGTGARDSLLARLGRTFAS